MVDLYGCGTEIYVYVFKNLYFKCVAIAIIAEFFQERVPIQDSF